MIYYEVGSPTTVLSDQEIEEGLFEALHKIGPREKVLAIPPDITRYYSKAGLITQMAWDYYGDKLTDVLPALVHATARKPRRQRHGAGIPRDFTDRLES